MRSRRRSRKRHLRRASSSTFVVVELEGQHLAAGEDLELSTRISTAPVARFGLIRSVGARRPCRGADAELVAQRLGDLVRVGRVGRVDDELHDAGAVAQVDEDRSPWSRTELTQPETRTSSSMPREPVQRVGHVGQADVAALVGAVAGCFLRSGHASQSTDAASRARGAGPTSGRPRARVVLTGAP